MIEFRWAFGETAHKSNIDFFVASIFDGDLFLMIVSLKQPTLLRTLMLA